MQVLGVLQQDTAHRYQVQIADPLAEPMAANPLVCSELDTDVANRGL